jgi:hypothetical protein
MAVVTAGMGICGLINFLFTSRLPSGKIFIIAISTILSVDRFTPVVSKSIKAIGRTNCKDIGEILMLF